MNKKEIKIYSSFAEVVYGYYNGKINGLKSHSFDIISEEPAYEIFGTNIFGHLEIILCGRDIMYNSENEIKCSIIVTVIHELFHVDQIINYSAYSNNKEYMNKIEVDATCMTYLYLLNNSKELREVFSVIPSKRFIDSWEEYVMSHANYYERINSTYSYYSHRLSSLGIYSNTILELLDRDLYVVMADKSDTDNGFWIKKNGVFNNDMSLFEKISFDIYNKLNQGYHINFILSRHVSEKGIEITALFYTIE